MLWGNPAGRSRRDVSCRFTIGVAAVLIALAIVPAGAWAATYTVNTLADSTATSDECLGVPSDCSLRQALDKVRQGDVIGFDVTGQINLNAANGPLQVFQRGVTINGPGASRLAIDGGGAIRILTINEGDVTVTGLTFQNGRSTAPSGSVAQGGAIYSAFHGKLTIAADAFVDDTAQGTDAGQAGGALAFGDASYTGDATGYLVVKDSTFSNDSATGPGLARGGAIYANAVLTIDRSTFVGNAASSSNGQTTDGGAVWNTGLSATIANTTFKDNSAISSTTPFSYTGYGTGGAFAFQGVGGTLVDDTIDGNSASFNGGAIGGAAHLLAYGTIFWANVRYDTSGAPQDGDCDAGLANWASTTSYNIEQLYGSCSMHAAEMVDPMLGPLADNGGPTETQAITPGSRAYGAVPAAVCRSAPFLQTDQRGLPRPGNGKANCDSGAYEHQAATTTTALASSESPSTAGGQVTFTATVSPTPDAGTVSFTDGGTTISGCGAAAISATGQATCQATYPAAGSHSIVGSYSGDAAFTSSDSPPLVQVVQQAPADAGSGSGAAGGSGGGGGQQVAGGQAGGAPPAGSTGGGQSANTVTDAAVRSGLRALSGWKLSKTSLVFSQTFATPGTARWTVTMRPPRKKHAVTIGTATKTVTRAGKVKLTIKFTTAGRRLLAKAHKPSLTLTTQFATKPGHLITVTVSR
jgi:predicted outer membrane repeat protein